MTDPNLEMIVTNALVVDVLPLVPEMQMIFRFLASSRIARGYRANRTNPGIVSPDFRRIDLDREPANLAIRIEILSLKVASQSHLFT